MSVSQHQFVNDHFAAPQVVNINITEDHPPRRRSLVLRLFFAVVGSITFILREVTLPIIRVTVSILVTLMVAFFVIIFIRNGFDPNATMQVIGDQVQSFLQVIN